ncbi:MATE family efflux transporter [Candidatus Kapabacteria bacterium]|nr:MATE family efflux transporter [Candidatus Kapabacteria bacterium]
MKLIKLIKTALSGSYDKLTEGSINLAIVMLAIPMIIEMIGESIFAVVDAYFVGQLGSYALSTVGLTEAILFLIYSIAIGISAAVTAIVARRTGENNTKLAANATFQAILISLILSILISIVGFYFSKDLLSLMGGDPETIEKGQGYMYVMLVGNLPILFLFMLNGAFRGAGNAAIAMYSLLIGNIINMILDPFLIFGWWIFPEMGIEGAAMSSVIGRGVGVLFQIYFLQRKSSKIRITKENLVVRYKTISNMLRIASGGIFQYLISSASWIILTRITSELGQSAVAANTIVMRIVMFTLLPSWGVANAAATLVGQNLGAKKPDRAEKSVWRAAHINAIYLLVICASYLIFANDLANIFSTELSVVQSAGSGLQIIALGYIFYGYGMIISQSFNGAGDTFTPMMLNVVSFIMIQAPVAYLLAIPWGYGQNGIFISISASYSLMACLAMIIFKLGKWKTKQV